MRAVAPDVLIAFRHSPQRIGDLAARMHPLLILIENEEHELIEKLVDLHGVAKSGDLVPSVATAIESISFKGELPFQYSDVVTDPDNLTRIKDEKAIMFCDCKDVCVPETCCCCTGDYEVDSEGETIIRPESLNSRMNAISECGPACACRIDCGNRLVQSRGKNYQLELTHTRDRGVGVLAKEKIPAGRFIIEYTGSVRELNNTDVTSDYRFETILGLKRVEIDSLHTGSAARCFNHCCTPNTVIDELACLCGSDGCKHNEAARQLKLEERRLQEAENEESDEDEEHDGDTDLGNADGQDDEECIEDEDSIDVEESGDEEDEDEEEIVEVHFARVEEVMVNYLVEEYVEVDEEDDEDVNVDDITEPPTSERDEVNVEVSKFGRNAYLKHWQRSISGPRTISSSCIQRGDPIEETNKNKRFKVDNEEIHPDFVYSPRIVDVEGILKKREILPEMFCDCSSICGPSCACWSGAYETSQNEGVDGWKNRTIRPSALCLPVAECSDACACSLHCGNRVAQKGAIRPLEIFRTRDRGWGLRSFSTIPAGSFISEYTGELIGNEAANERDDKYLFETIMGDRKLTIDAHFAGNSARFINHSCEPNAKVGMVYWEPSYDNHLNHVCVFASKEIRPGEEITIHYGHSWWLANITLFPCKCGSPDCKYDAITRRKFIDFGVEPDNPRLEKPDEIPP
ncbi:hypothetical protein PMAYCL1PPCAC_04471 [Pristionchus mayeri]|uniref:SET domain-containing protein n=1 Tax=Pristionchus mayeri TaxID=1317129 RepID=A0AAN4Z573_9BILA|nr:hypothetical protein PMAYCL1PPCAC_04471 [Pristionchus mayeri]